jgi:exodeoxyribonuclease-3
MGAMRIATWNVNGLRARLDFVRLWLEDRQPDVVGLQELKVEDDDFPHDMFNALGYEVLTHGQKSWNGVAIASRLPMEISAKGLPGQEDFGARLITAQIEDLSFTTVYCPNGKDIDHDDFPRKLAWYDALRVLHDRRAHPTGIAHRLRPVRPVPGAPSTRPDVFVVGLPGGFFPPRPGPAHRLRPRHRRRT